MSIVPMARSSVQPWEPHRDPEYAVLRVCLERAGYTQHAIERICDFIEREGTLEGLVELGYIEPVDYETAECALVAGLETVPTWSARWDDPDRWAPAALACDPEEYEPTAEELLDFGSFLDQLTDEQIDALAAEACVDPDDLVPLDDLVEEITAPLDLPPLSGGSPEADRYEPTEEDLADYDDCCRADDVLRAILRDEDGRVEADRYRGR